MRPAIATDHDLIEQLKKHDEHAVTELVVTYKPKVYQLAFRYLRNKEDAEEVSQDVLDSTGISGFVTGEDGAPTTVNLIPASPPEDAAAWRAAWTEVKAG